MSKLNETIKAMAAGNKDEIDDLSKAAIKKAREKTKRDKGNAVQKSTVEKPEQLEKETLLEPEVALAKELKQPEKEIQPETEVAPEQEIQREPKVDQQIKGSSLPKKNVKKNTNEGNLLDNIKNFESKVGDDFLHIRVNSKTRNMINHLTHVTKISNTKIVGYALADFFSKNPELEEMIKNYLKNVEL